jgi:Domain of unknown function (DUF1906)
MGHGEPPCNLDAVAPMRGYGFIAVDGRRAKITGWARRFRQIAERSSLCGQGGAFPPISTRPKSRGSQSRSVEIAMATLYAGFDSFAFVPLSYLESLLKNTCLTWLAYYFDDPNVTKVAKPGEKQWSGTYEDVRNMGWGVAPVYFGKSTRMPKNDKEFQLNRKFQKLKDDVAKTRPILRGKYKTDAASVEHAVLVSVMYNNGWLDGMEASNMAKADRIPSGTVIYFDMESHGALGQDFWFDEWIDYYKGWLDAVYYNNYRAGLYSYVVTCRTVIAGLTTRTWAGVRPPPYIWIAQYEHPVATYTATKDGIYLGDQQSNAKVTSGKSIEGDPTSKFAAATSWQHTGGSATGHSTLKWLSDKHWRTWIPVDFNSSLFPDPGRPTS